MSDALASTTPRIAVVIPIYRHPSLVVEAIEAVLEQRFEGGLRLFLVNDGCRMRETDMVCRDYTRALPSIVTYLRKRNGGLSDARNFGIRHAIENLPSVEAIYMLDADNRLRPDSLARAMAALDENPDVDWIYPNIDMFGLERFVDYGGPYSSLIHTEMNVCEAGSLIRRRVFETGLLFDTEFKMGWEDWDFFLSASRKGFRGRNLENFGFLYRKRPESMLANSNREQGQLLGAMQQKHKPILTPRALLQMEQEEAPRYAIHMADRGETLYCVDPESEGSKRVSFASFENDYFLAKASGGQTRTPPFNIFMSADMIEGLREVGLLHWVLWRFEILLKASPIASLKVLPGSEGRMSVTELRDANRSGQHRDTSAIAFSARLMEDVLRDARSDWVDSLARDVAQPQVTSIMMHLPPSSPSLARLRRTSSTYDTLSMIHWMRTSRFRDAMFRRWSHRENGIPLRGHEHEIVRRRIAQAPVLPRVTDGRKHVGFILPLVEFGGVEKVALQMARGLRAHGWVPHAFVLQSTDIALTPDWAAIFESTNPLADPEFRQGGGRQDYLGTEVPAWAESGRHGTVLGLLHWLDAAINFHGGAAVGVMGQLRRMGIRTLNSLHLNDLTAMGRPVGNTYLGLAYEHAFDYFIPCSHQLGDWLRGMGVPDEKIVPVPNGPGFEIAPEVSARAIRERAARGRDEPLRVLYLGRLDRQKGLDRLTEVIRATKSLRIAVAWRVIGKSIIGEGAPTLAPEIEEILEPALSRPADLAAAYAWADVVVLMSRFEGLPLTILEARRAGAFVIATDVGAVAEAVWEGENGILLSEDEAVTGCIEALSQLAQNPEKARGAHESVESRRWPDLVEPLVKVLELP